jgi:hypothetical protein
MEFRDQRYLITILLLVIAASAGLAAINVSFFPVPRAIFIAMTGITFLLMALLIFGMIYLPLRDGVYARLLPNGIVVLLFMISAIKLAMSGFAFDDEIYSWNMWAIQHFLGQTASFEFTGAPYPQLFPYWITSLYLALGTITIHSVPRFFLALPTLLLAMAVIAQARILNWRTASIVSLIIILAFGSISIRLAKGLADPLMAAAMVVSAMLLVAYAREPQKLVLLWLAVACAIVASLTKQAGLIWACFSLPATVAVGCRYYRWPKRALFLAGATLLISTIWPLWIAPTFTNNAGVIHASMENRTYLQQFEYAIKTYLVGRPEISVLLISCVVATWRHGILRLLVFVAVLPMLLAWFLFGAYEIRLGMHVLVLMALLTISATTSPTFDPSTAAAGSEAGLTERVLPLKAILLAGLVACGIFLIIWQSVFFLAKKNSIDLHDGAKATLRTQYGPASKIVFDRILEENARVWATSGYTYGPFYGRLPVALPDYSEKPYTTGSVKKNLLEFAADYASQSGQIATPASQLLSQLAKQCPDAFQPVLQPPNQYGFTLYKVNRQQLSENCHD